MLKIVISLGILVMVSNCGNGAITQDKKETLDNKQTLVISPNEQEVHKPVPYATKAPNHTHKEMHKQGIIHIHTKGN